MSTTKEGRGEIPNWMYRSVLIAIAAMAMRDGGTTLTRIVNMIADLDPKIVDNARERIRKGMGMGSS